MAFFHVVAVDCDGTLTSRGEVSAKALDAIDTIRRNGVVVVLVTGRIGAELQAEFPQIASHADALVLENGAVTVIGGRTQILAAPVDDGLGEALTECRVPYRRGEVLLAIDGQHAAAVVEVIGQLGLDHQIIYNRGALMVLPAGVTKGSGLGAVLAEMNLAAHNMIAVGDAENDLSLLEMAEIGVAVADAIPSVRQHADLVLDQPDGDGVVDLLTGPYLSGARRWCPPRRWIEIGVFADGTPTRVPGSQGRILVTGPAGAGKSYLTGLLAEQWVLAGYSVVVVDPEGDHTALQQLNQLHIVDARRYLPEPIELLSMLGPRSSVVVDLSALTQSTKVDYLHRLRFMIQAHREQHGFPHWVIYDEAHLLGGDEPARWARRGGWVFSSFAPKSLPPNEIDSTDVTLELIATNSSGEAGAQPPRRAAVRFGSGPPRRFTIAERRTQHVRHRHKYADVSLPKERCFYFRPSDGQYITPAASMHGFRTAVAQLDAQTLQYHLERGDFSRWLAHTIADMDLAAQVAAWEDKLLAHRAADLQHIRGQLVRAVEDRYLDAPDHH